MPLNYDRPAGAKVELALLRLKARHPAHRIGSLLVNPGGPGGPRGPRGPRGPAAEMAYFSDGILSPRVLDRFDIVGMDPRGVGFSDNVRCFPGPRELMRRAVGDSKLSYLGLSYGTYLGQVYAALFPQRVRAVTIDGVLDPVAWAGSPQTYRQPLQQRLRSSQGAWKALREIDVDPFTGDVFTFD